MNCSTNTWYWSHSIYRFVETSKGGFSGWVQCASCFRLNFMHRDVILIIWESSKGHCGRPPLNYGLLIHWSFRHGAGTKLIFLLLRMMRLLSVDEWLRCSDWGAEARTSASTPFRNRLYQSVGLSVWETKTLAFSVTKLSILDLKVD